MDWAPQATVYLRICFGGPLKEVVVISLQRHSVISYGLCVIQEPFEENGPGFDGIEAALIITLYRCHR